MKMYETGAYWRKRSDMLYYQYFSYIIRCIGAQAGSLVDVGSGNAPYLEWFDWIPRRVSVDLKVPYRSESVEGVTGDIRDLRFDETFDICTCMQVLEHVPEPEPFARRLMELGSLVLISVPYKWPKGANKDHVNDPVGLESVVAWFGRQPNYHLVVREPFVRKKGARMFAIFDVADPQRKFGADVRGKRRPATVVAP
jgi:SAM-dependent methyltransferase